jgi:hypothetical protein
MTALTRTLALIPLVVASLCTNAAAQVDLTERISRSVTAADVTAVDVTNIRGAITITGGGPGVTIEAVKRVPVRGRGAAARNLLRMIDVQIAELSGRVEIRTVVPRPRVFPGGVDYTIGVPSGTALTLRTGVGDVQVSHVRGELRAVVVDGSLRVSGADNVALLRCLSGSIELTDASAETAALVQTVNGNVRVRNVTARALQVTSVSGNLSVETATVNRLALKSTSGNVSFQGALLPAGIYEFTSHAGAVDVALAGGTGFELRASSFGGTASTTFKLDRARPGRPTDESGGRTLRGTVGNASARIVARSFSGDVTVRRRSE